MSLPGSIRTLAVLGAATALGATMCACGGSSSSSSASSGTEPASAAATTRATAATTAASAVTAAAGKKVFLATCTSCHTLADAGSTGTVGPNLDDLEPDMATVVHQVTNGGGAMPAFAGRLSDVQIKSVAKYVSSVAGSGGGAGGGGVGGTP
jgi:mono/diheme cytochrome c family protein